VVSPLLIKRGSCSKTSNDANTPTLSLELPDGVRCRSSLALLVDDCATPGPHRVIRKWLAGHAVGTGPTSNRTHELVTRRGDVQLPDVAHAGRERGQLAGLDSATDLVAASTACNDDVITL
jgi:hypothetical protein